MSEPTKVVKAVDVIRQLEQEQEEAEATKPEAASDEPVDELADQSTDTEGLLAAGDEGEGDDGDETEVGDVDDDGEGYELPALIPEIANNPEALQRVKAFEKGVKKVVERAKAREAELEQHLPRVQAMESWGRALSDPHTAPAAFRQMALLVQDQTGLSIDQLTGRDAHAAAVPEPEGGDGDWEAMGFDSPGEYRAYRKAVDDVEAKFAPHLQEIEQARREREEQRQQKDFESKVSAVADRVIKRIGAEDAGWKVTKAMVREALANLPQFGDRPAQAVRMWFSDQRARHMAKASYEQQALPTMPAASRNTSGDKLPPPGKLTAKDVLRIMNSSG